MTVYLHTWRFLQGAGSWEQGVWWFRCYGYGLHIKAPWSFVFFSERYGKRRYWPRNGKGWRFRPLTPRE